ncbi:receptor-type tyrosine-protein phosphatase kappa-like isoform X2 [Hyperolius riggenbachi]
MLSTIARPGTGDVTSGGSSAGSPPSDRTTRDVTMPDTADSTATNSTATNMAPPGMLSTIARPGTGDVTSGGGSAGSPPSDRTTRDVTMPDTADSTATNSTATNMAPPGMLSTIARPGTGDVTSGGSSAEKCKGSDKSLPYTLSRNKTFYDLGEEVNVTCKKGSYRPSPERIRCVAAQDNPKRNDWNGSPYCIKKCKGPNENQTYTLAENETFYNPGKLVTVKCKEGYHPLHQTIQCIATNDTQGTPKQDVWNPPPPWCIAQCKRPNIQNANISAYREYYKRSDVITIQCKPGNYPSHETMTCDNTLKWSPPSVTCLAQCKRPTIENATISAYRDYYNRSEKIRIQCNPGYYPSNDTMTCRRMNKALEWSPPSVTCLAQCKRPDIQNANISTHRKYYKRNDTIRIQCNPGYYPSNDTMACDNTSEWSPPSVTCLAPDPPDIKKSPTMENSTLKWELSNYHGIITHLQMNISAWRNYNESFSEDTSLWMPPNVTERRLALQYGTNYSIALQAFTAAGGGNITARHVETDIGDPPRHTEKTLRDFTLQLYPVDNTNGPISSYEVIMFGGQERNRSVECMNFPSTLYNTSRTASDYTAVFIPAQNLTRARNFTLGDNQHYGGFHNTPLLAKHKYTIYIRVTSRWKELQKSSCAFAGFIKGSEPESSTAYVMAGSLSAVFVLLLLVMLILVIAWRMRSPRKLRRSSDIPLKAQAGLGRKKNIPVEDLLEVVKRFRREEIAECEEEEDNSEMPPLGRYLEYTEIPAGLGGSCAVAQTERNQAKNRYKKVVPYDESRVVLRSNPSGSDYINASYIDGFRMPQAYIATQGPTPDTLADFWNMVWQENSSVIVMLTGLEEQNKVKCERYWPEQSQTYGDITVSVQKIVETGAITIRSFSLKKAQSMVQVTVEQLHYLRWPDHGVPRNTSDMVQLVELMNRCNTPGSGPVIVHCSAGIGRTGTFLALDILLKMAKAVRRVNVYNCVLQLRKKRVKMVQEKEQYIFLYDVLLETLLCGATSVPVSEIQKHYQSMSVLDPRTSMSGYKKEFLVVEKITELYQIYSCKEAKKLENWDKNRNPNILPGDHCRPVLLSALTRQGAPGYINAVFVNTSSREDGVIVTQLPLKQTLGDFWALVWDYKCTAVVMMQGAADLQENGCRFWPEKGETRYGVFRVRTTARNTGSGYTVSTLSLRKSDESPDTSLEVKLWQLDSWPLDKPLPGNLVAVISVIGETEKWQQQTSESHILVTCSDGASRSGLLCAGIILCDQIRSDGCLDVSQAVRSLRRRRSQFIPSLEQYLLCYTLAQTYLDSFETYGNFK